MEEISLHVLDIVQNSLSADAALIHIEVDEQEQDDTLSVQITDDGRGMPPEFVEKVTDPFVTTRTTRKVGLGLYPLVGEQGRIEVAEISPSNRKSAKGRGCARRTAGRILTASLSGTWPGPFKRWYCVTPT